MSQCRVTCDQLDAVHSATQGRAQPCRGHLACWLGVFVLLECLPHSPSFLEPTLQGRCVVPTGKIVHSWWHWGSRYRLDQQTLQSSQMMENIQSAGHLGTPGRRQKCHRAQAKRIA